MVKIIPEKDWILSDGVFYAELKKGVEVEILEKFVPSLESEGVVKKEDKVLKKLETTKAKKLETKIKE